VNPRSLLHGFARVLADPLDHRHKAVGALWRQVLLEMKLAKDAVGINGEDVVGGLAGIERKQDGDQAPDDMGITVADEA